MAGSVNKVILVGNLGDDPEIRRTQDGRPIANLRIATSVSPSSIASIPAMYSALSVNGSAAPPEKTPTNKIPIAMRIELACERWRTLFT